MSNDTYADGTFGHNQTAPSRDAAESDRVQKITRQSMKDALHWVGMSMNHGVTAKEMDEHLGIGHGRTSSALTNLHRIGRIVALADRRGNQTVYVHPRHVGSRKTREYRRQIPKPSVIESLGELEMLPPGSVVIDSTEEVFVADLEGEGGHRWFSPGAALPTSSESVWGDRPLRLLYRPEGSKRQDKTGGEE